MSIRLPVQPETLRRTFSFYLSGADPLRIRSCAGQADGLVLLGASGPKSVRRLRSEGWDGVVLFDRGAYARPDSPVDSTAWFEYQFEAGADRLLTPGTWASWGVDPPPLADQIANEFDLAFANGATAVVAVDYRWLTNAKGFDQLLETLTSAAVPVALVLGDKGDPLHHSGAVNSLIALTTQVSDLTLLRIDHGGLGALAFDAIHVSIGLIPSHRHVVPPGQSGFSIPDDRSPRLFVQDLMDWFTAYTVASWSTVRVSPTCQCFCCDGRRIDRFIDERVWHEAELHNRAVISSVADHILSLPREERRRGFARLCAEALERYGIMGGLSNQIAPKAQLEQWAQYF